MNTKNEINATIILVATMMALIVGGCASPNVKTYQGQTLSSQNHAVVEVARNTQGGRIWIMKVDDYSTEKGFFGQVFRGSPGASSVLVLPGKRTIKSRFDTGSAYAYSDLMIEAEPGATYVIQAERVGSRIRMWIENRQTHKSVSMRADMANLNIVQPSDGVANIYEVDFPKSPMIGSISVLFKAANSNMLVDDVNRFRELAKDVTITNSNSLIASRQLTDLLLAWQQSPGAEWHNNNQKLSLERSANVLLTINNGVGLNVGSAFITVKDDKGTEIGRSGYSIIGDTVLLQYEINQITNTFAIFNKNGNR